MHDLVHQEGRPGHITGILQQGKQNKEDEDVGKEGNDGTAALHDAVDQQAGQPAGRQHVRQPGAQELHAVFDPLLRQSAEGKGGFEDQEKDHKKQRVRVSCEVNSLGREGERRRG